MGNLCAGDERLCRRATRVDARTTDQVALDHGHGHACGREPADQRRARLAGANDDGVEMPDHGYNIGRGIGQLPRSAFSRASSSLDRRVARSRTSAEGIPILAVLRTVTRVPDSMSMTL